MNKLHNILKATLPLAILVGTGLFANALFNSQPKPRDKPREDRGLLVEVTTARARSHQTVVEAQGTVVPAYAMDLAAENSGRVIWTNPNLTTGGLVRAGDPLIKLDARDYKLALKQQEAAVAQAKVEMELELGRKAVAEREWKLFGNQTGASGKLATREPQLKAVELGLETARDARSQAKLRLDRTTVRAPFNALVRTNRAETGSMVAVGTPMAELVSTDVFMTVANLPVEDLAWLKVPEMNAPAVTSEEFGRAYRAQDSRGALAELTTYVQVRQKVGDGYIERAGFVTRLLGDLDPVGRMARVLVAIIDPMGLAVSERPEGVAGLPLLLGAYVSADLYGRVLDGVVEVPRLALRDGDTVYLVDRDDRLEVRPVDVIRRRADSVLVRAGLANGDRIITSVVPSALPGMELRVVSAEQSKNQAVETAAKPVSPDEQKRESVQ